MIISLIILLSVSPGVLFVQGQVQGTLAQKMVIIAEKATQQVQSLIDNVQLIQNAEETIEAVGLGGEYRANVTLFETESKTNLEEAHFALESGNYEGAVDYAFASLRISRETYILIRFIIQEAGLTNNELSENQGLLDSIDRQLEEIDRLQEILPDTAPQEILDYLSNAQAVLDDAKLSLISDDSSSAKTMLIEAEKDIQKVFDYLKQQAEESTQIRLSDYCQKLQQRVQERLRYGANQGVDLTSTLQSLGYESEAQFMAILQNRIQAAQGEQSFQVTLQECEQISMMVQQMEQAVNQQVNQYQGQNGPTSSGAGNGGNNGRP